MTIPSKIVSDFDGVIGNSIDIAMAITKKIVSLFEGSYKINSFADFYRLLGKESELKNVTEKESDTLRELYRILYRHNTHKIDLYYEVIDIYAKLSHKPLIVTSSYADAVKKVLGSYCNLFDDILGYETNRKMEHLLKLKSQYSFVYISDTIRDIKICKIIDVPVVATCWGYDPYDKIKLENPDYIVKSFGELNEFLISNAFINNERRE